MLRKFGQLLEKVNLNLNFEDAQHLAEYYLLSIKLVHYLPNVKKLIFRCNTRGIENIPTNRLNHVTETNTCPKLKKLKYLYINESLPAQMLQELLRQNHDFQKLTLYLKNVEGLFFDFVN